MKGRDWQRIKPALQATLLCWMLTLGLPAGAWADCGDGGDCAYVGFGQTVNVMPEYAGASPACQQIVNATCATVTNPLTVMVPDSNPAEWQSFLDNHEPCVSIGSCAATPTVSLTADPATIASGGSTTLTWTVTGNPTSCTASGDASFNGPASITGGTASVSPTATTTYSLTCSNDGVAGNTATTTVTVGSVMCPGGTFSANDGDWGNGTVPATPVGYEGALACNVQSLCAVFISCTSSGVWQQTLLMNNNGGASMLKDPAP